MSSRPAPPDATAAKPTAAGKIRALVVDDHAVVRMGLIGLLHSEPDLACVGEADDGEAALAQFRALRPDVVLMDLRMPKLGGVEATAAILAEDPQARVIVLTTYDGDEEIFRALEAGARAYLTKSMLGKELVTAVRAVHAGQLHIPPEIAARLAERMRRSQITPRELDVLELIAKGLSNKRIGVALDVSEGTVKTHVINILAKLGAEDRTGAVTIALRRGLIRLE